MRKKKVMRDFMDLNRRDFLIRVSPLFKELIDEKRQKFIRDGLTRQQASDRFITHRLAKELRKQKNRKFIEL